MGSVLIGIDCATKDPKIGLCRAEESDGRATLTHAELGSDNPPIEERIAAWLEGARTGVIALDAPLGWPAPLADALEDHKAGEPMGCCSNELFRRTTDNRVRKTPQKIPLEIGAAWISRTAVHALDLLHEIRQSTGRRMPLARSQGPVAEVVAIEVYPAATLKAHGLPHSGYKTPARRASRSDPREEIIQGLQGRMDLGRFRAQLLANSDVLDAAVCVLAALDFLEMRTRPPDKDEVSKARREGWIWVLDPDTEPRQVGS